MKRSVLLLIVFLVLPIGLNAFAQSDENMDITVNIERSAIQFDVSGIRDVTFTIYDQAGDVDETLELCVRNHPQLGGPDFTVTAIGTNIGLSGGFYLDDGRDGLPNFEYTLFIGDKQLFRNNRTLVSARDFPPDTLLALCNDNAFAELLTVNISGIDQYIADNIAPGGTHSMSDTLTLSFEPLL